MRPGIDRSTSYASGDCLTSRPKGHSQPRELWLSIYSCTHPKAGLVAFGCAESVCSNNGKTTQIAKFAILFVMQCTQFKARKAYEYNLKLNNVDVTNEFILTCHKKTF